MEINMLKLISLLSRYAFPSEGLSDVFNALLSYFRAKRDIMQTSHIKVYTKLIRIYGRLLEKSEKYDHTSDMNSIDKHSIYQLLDEKWSIG